VLLPNISTKRNGPGERNLVSKTDDDLIAVVRLFLKDNLAIVKPRLQPQPVPQGLDLYRFLDLIFPSLLHGKTDTAAAEMFSMSQSQVTRIKNRKLIITRVTARSLAERLEGAWYRMMAEAPALATIRRNRSIRYRLRPSSALPGISNRPKRPFPQRQGATAEL
jgi:hypothetical protein